jgi:hypothetical protein
MTTTDTKIQSGVVEVVVKRDELLSIIACMDEGMGEMAYDDEEHGHRLGYPCIRVSGSGILLGNTWESAVEEAVAFVGRLRADGIAVEAIADHKHCGAAAVKADQLDHEGGVDALFAKFVAEVASFAGVEHINAPLSRPTTHHDATAIYYVDVPFHPLCTFAEGDDAKAPLENGFVISRFALDKRPALNDLEMAAEIALGKHGLGTFTVDNPLKIFVVGNADLDDLDSEIDPIVTDLREQFGDVISVAKLYVTAEPHLS